MELEFLKSLVIIFGASAVVVFLLNRMRIPSIVGFLVAGAIIGPHGIGIVIALSAAAAYLVTGNANSLLCLSNFHYIVNNI